jgi:hypothetical protein
VRLVTRQLCGEHPQKGDANMADLFGVPKYPQFTLNLALVFVHKHLLLPNIGSLREMSRE